MDMRFSGFEAATSLRLLMIGVATIVALAAIVTVARRRQSYWWTSVALIAVGYAAMALSSYFAVRMLIATFDDMAVSGGGIRTVSTGIWQATQLPLASAWAALFISALAAGVALPRIARRDPAAENPQRTRRALFGALSVLAVAGGLVPVVLFRRAIAVVMREVMPGTGSASGAQIIASQLTTTAVLSALCFAVAAVLVIATLRVARRPDLSRHASPVTAMALVLSLGVSAALVVNLSSSSTRFRDIALNGRLR